MDLKKFIYEFNLVSTLTLKDKEQLCYVDDLKKEIDYSNSISLYDLAFLFNKQYLYFEKDYKRLEKYDFGEYISFLRFAKNEKSRYLIIYISNPNKDICKQEETLLYLVENENKTYSFVTNDINCYDPKYYKIDVKLSSDVVKRYLDFGERQELFLQSYNFLKNKFIFGNGTTVLFSKINGRVLERLESLVISFGNVYFNAEDYANIVLKIGDNLNIDYDSSDIFIHSIDIQNKREYIDEVINNLYINREKLPRMYDKEKRLIKEMK